MHKDTVDQLSRRKFLRATGITGVGLWLGWYLPANAAEPKIGGAADVPFSEIEMNPWVRIGTDGKISIFSHRAEMGQGVYQAIPQMIAEELEVDLDQVSVLFAPGNKEKFGSQVTGGSSTVRGSYKNLLKLSATARILLIQAAAERLKVPVSECYAASAHVVHLNSGKKISYGELVEEASKLKAPENVPLKKRSEYKLIGKPLRRKDTALKTDGSAQFGIDFRLPGMLYAVVERSPKLRGKVKNFDSSAAMKVPGVRKIFKNVFKVYSTDRESVVVVADSTWAALKARKLLKVEWNDDGFEHVNSKEIYERQRAALQSEEGINFKSQGDATTVLKTASDGIDVVYETPYQAHACMEPLNCVAHYQGDKIEVWGPIQGPDWVREFLSDEMKMPISQVTVNMTFLGGGFGRKAFLDYPHETVLISKEMNAPVMTVWTREDDMTQGPFRPGMSYRCEGAIENGRISAFKVRLAGQNMGHFQGADKSKPNDSDAEGFLAPYYESIKNLSIADIVFETPIPVMWWRSVYASTNGFAYESFVNELAHKAQKDPLEFRREHLNDDRLHLQIDKMIEVSGWARRKKNEGFGVAITECFQSTVGQIVKVSKKPGGGIQVDHVWAVVDCGWYVNPDTIRAQVEGSIIMALGAAAYQEITFTNGVADQQNFYNYAMPRIMDIPPIEVFIIDNDEDAGGVGEPGLPPFAPALTEAIFDLTGKRIRKLPFRLEDV